MNEITVLNEATVETSFGQRIVIIGEASGFLRKRQYSLLPNHRWIAAIGEHSRAVDFTPKRGICLDEERRKTNCRTISARPFPFGNSLAAITF